MSGQNDFLQYHKSIAKELQVTKNRVQNLIGTCHWPTVGKHKEAILRKVLKDHIAETFHVGTGFVCGPNATSHQIDILISSRDRPILFGDGELRFVTPDAATGIVEVKTRLPGNLYKFLRNLADDAEMIRTYGNPRCVAGLFVYELDNRNSLERILQITREVANGNERRVINWIAAGPDIFVRHWCRGEEVQSDVQGPVWHGYVLEDLAHAYFLSNIVWDTCPNLDLGIQYAWFPLKNGKEIHRKLYIGLNDTQPTRFGASE